MNKEERINKSEAKTEELAELFGKGFNCCQSVLAAYAPELGMDSQTALRVASSFGGGMGRMGEVCGAVTGALMVIGLKYGNFKEGQDDARERTYDLIREFSDKFRELHGTIICRDLIGSNISTEEGLKRAKRENLFQDCSVFVETAARILEELFD